MKSWLGLPHRTGNQPHRIGQRALDVRPIAPAADRPLFDRRGPSQRALADLSQYQPQKVFIDVCFSYITRLVERVMWYFALCRRGGKPKMTLVLSAELSRAVVAYQISRFIGLFAFLD